MGNDLYPKTIPAATDSLANHKHDNYVMKCDEKYKRQEKQDGDDNRNTATNETSLHNLVE